LTFIQNSQLFSGLVILSLSDRFAFIDRGALCFCDFIMLKESLFG